VTEPSGPARGADPASEARRALAEEIARITAENAALMARLAEGERRFRLISRGVMRLQEAERGRIARELHDGVGQSLTALKMRIELLEQSAAGGEGSLARPLAELRELAEHTLLEVRQVSHLLRPQMLDELGLAPTLRWLVRSFETRTGMAVELFQEGVEEERVDPELETLLYRVVQEALTNAAKHARTRSARVRLHPDGRRLRLTIEDGGAGFDVEAALAVREEGGYGLRGMRDRVQLVGGSFSIRSAAGEGTRIEAEIPLGAEGRP